MKKLLMTLVVMASVTLPLAIPTVSHAAFNPFGTACNTDTKDSAVCTEVKNATDENPLTGTSGVIIRAARLIAYITGIASVIMLIFSGIKYQTSNGDSNSVNSAKNTMLYAVVGLVVSAMAQGIIGLVINRQK